MNTSTALKIDQLGYCVPTSLGPRWLFRGFSRVVAPGTIVGLVGANGSGKTTLLKLLAEVATPSEGSCEWSHSYFSPGGGGVYIRQGLAPCLVPWLDVGSHLELLVDDRPTSESLVRGLRRSQLSGQKVATLSGGERQMALLGMLAVVPWRVCLLDEPFSALDGQRSQKALVSLRSTAKRTRGTVVIVLHRWAQVAFLADEIWAISESRKTITSWFNPWVGNEQAMEGKGLGEFYVKLHSDTI